MVRSIKRQVELEQLQQKTKELDAQLIEIRKGGSREGSGRKRIGETKKVSVTLPHGYWELVEEARNDISRSEYIRKLVLQDLKQRGLN